MMCMRVKTSVLMASASPIFILGCLGTGGCGSDTNCFFGKLDTCEEGATLSSKDGTYSMFGGPESVKILGKDGDYCKILYSGGPSNVTIMGWTEDEMVDYTCLLSDYDSIIDEAGLMQPGIWIALHMEGTDSTNADACFTLATGLGDNRNNEFGEW